MTVTETEKWELYVVGKTWEGRTDNRMYGIDRYTPLRTVNDALRVAGDFQSLRSAVVIRSHKVLIQHSERREL